MLDARLNLCRSLLGLALLPGLLWFTGCQSPPAHAPTRWYSLRWLDKPARQGASTRVPAEQRTSFVPVSAFDRREPAHFETALAQLQEGDVIGYRMPASEVAMRTVAGQVNVLGYLPLAYGHLAMVARDPESQELRLFSSVAFVGPNIREPLTALRRHDWDAWRLDRATALDFARLREFVTQSTAKAGNWRGYDFTGIFGIWNGNLRPEKPAEISREYICSTLVVAAYFYAGVELDAIRRWRAGDLVGPLQVVQGAGALRTPPEGTWEVVVQEPAGK